MTQLWPYFEELCNIPRPSKAESKAVDYVLEFARKHALEVVPDTGGNVLLRKPGSIGREHHPTVALQSHLDMVCQKHPDLDFDFHTQSIPWYRDEDWILTRGTTLGADNGIGVAAMLAVLADLSLQHPPLEALFTIDEETGMTGAKSFPGGRLQAKVMLNLDTEDDREITIGCAGGVDVSGQASYPEESVSASILWRLELAGLTGGHSGMDIHLGRANANKLMVRLLRAWPEARIHKLEGGGLRNAIPREATAWVSLGSGDPSARLQEILAEWTREFASTDPNLRLTWQPEAQVGPVPVVGLDFQRRLLAALSALPNGIYRLCPEMPGLVQTSNNLACLKLEGGRFDAHCLCRGSLDSEKMDMAAAISSALELIPAQVEMSGHYPGWQPQANSPLVQQMSSLYQKIFKEVPQVGACHAGLECGILGQNYPDLTMVSFGPNIRGAHSPQERVQVSSVAKFWQFLTALLEEL